MTKTYATAWMKRRNGWLFIAWLHDEFIAINGSLQTCYSTESGYCLFWLNPILWYSMVKTWFYGPLFIALLLRENRVRYTTSPYLEHKTHSWWHDVVMEISKWSKVFCWPKCEKLQKSFSHSSRWVAGIWTGDHLNESQPQPRRSSDILLGERARDDESVGKWMRVCATWLTVTV
jgi:hypothetical protein